jgi:hypothetical protein
MLPRVFIPQVVKRFDSRKGASVPVFDFTLAASFGMLTPILAEDDDPIYLARITPKIREALKDFSADDFFLAVGDPSVMAVCCGLILRRHKTMKMLKWDKKLARYFTIEVNP